MGGVRCILADRSARGGSLGVSARALSAAIEIQGRLAGRLRGWRSEREVQAGFPHLDHSYQGGFLRDLRQMHSSGMHAAMVEDRAEVQMSVPRHGLLYQRTQLR